MFLPIRDGIEEVLHELSVLQRNMKDSDCYLEHFEYNLRDKMVQRIK